MQWKIAAVLEPPHPAVRIRQVDISKLLGTALRHEGRCSVSVCVTALQQRKQRLPDATSHAGGAPQAGVKQYVVLLTFMYTRAENWCFFFICQVTEMMADFCILRHKNCSY